MPSNPTETVRRLKALIDHPDTPDNERTAAQFALDSLVRRHGRDILTEGFTHKKVRVGFPVRDKAERYLVQAAAAFMDLGESVFRLRTPDGKRWDSSKLYVEGPRVLVDAAFDLYQEHRRILRKKLDSVALGYSLSALPPPDDYWQRDDDDQAPARKRKGSGPDLDAMRSGMVMGARHRASRDEEPKQRPLLTAAPRALEG